MEQFLQEVFADLPEIIRTTLLFLGYFLVFWYRRRFKNTSTTLLLSMKEVLGKFATGKRETDDNCQALEVRLHKCEQALKILTTEKGGNTDDDTQFAFENEGSQIHSD